MIASDVSAPSLEKARTLLAAKGLGDRAKTVVCDGLAGIDVPADAIVIAGMGAEMILRIVREGIERIGNAALIVQSNVDLPMLRCGLGEMGFAVEREVYVRAAGRRYVTMLARKGEIFTPDEREALLGTAACGTGRTPELGGGVKGCVRESGEEGGLCHHVEKGDGTGFPGSQSAQNTGKSGQNRKHIPNEAFYSVVFHVVALPEVDVVLMEYG